MSRSSTSWWNSILTHPIDGLVRLLSRCKSDERDTTTVGVTLGALENLAGDDGGWREEALREKDTSGLDQDLVLSCKESCRFTSRCCSRVDGSRKSQPDSKSHMHTSTSGGHTCGVKCVGRFLQ